MNNNSLGEYIKKLRENVGISNRKLSIDASMSRTYLYNIEKGKQTSPKSDIVIRIAEALSNYGYDKFEVMKELLERIEEYTKKDIDRILDSEKLIEKKKHEENISDKNINTTDLSYILSSLTENVTFDINFYGKDYTITLGNNMKLQIQEAIEPIIKLHVLNNPDLLENDFYKNDSIDYTLGVNKANIMLQVDNENKED